MSYFVFMAYSGPIPGPSNAYPHLQFKDASDFPLGEITRGNKSRGSVFLVLADGYSHEVLGRGNFRRNYSSEFVGLLDALLAPPHPVSVLVHWAKGDYGKETIENPSKIKLSRDEFVGLFPNIEENKRYIVLPNSDGRDAGNS